MYVFGTFYKKVPNYKCTNLIKFPRPAGLSPWISMGSFLKNKLFFRFVNFPFFFFSFFILINKFYFLKGEKHG